MDSIVRSRRNVLRTIGGGVAIPFAGCGSRKPVRILTIRNLSVEEGGDGWIASLEIINQSEAADDLAVFHDVGVHGYVDDRTRVGSKDVGLVAARHDVNNGIPIEMVCTDFPTIITFSAAESPCDEDVRTVIKIATYDETNGWCHECHARRCGEGLPPEPRE